jgi:hypothetical protein
MGIDVRIEFSTKSGNLPDLDRCIYDIKKGGYQEGSMFVVVTYDRYYGIGYERGPWGKIAGVLMELFACEDVDKVWYGGDDYVELFTPEKVLEICAHYMKNGERPYRNGR